MVLPKGQSCREGEYSSLQSGIAIDFHAQIPRYASGDFSHDLIMLVNIVVSRLVVIVMEITIERGHIGLGGILPDVNIKIVRREKVQISIFRENAVTKDPLYLVHPFLHGESERGEALLFILFAVNEQRANAMAWAQGDSAR